LEDEDAQPVAASCDCNGNKIGGKLSKWLFQIANNNFRLRLESLRRAT
jgi:hypothetical protein